MGKIEYWLPSWEDIRGYCNVVVKKMKSDEYKPDLVVALSRGGYVPARIICDKMIIKNLASIKVDHWGITAAKDGEVKIRYPLSLTEKEWKDIKNVLVVDDITDTGDSMEKSKEYVSSLSSAQVKTAAALHIKTSHFKPDYYGKEIDWIWVVFPWNYVEDMCNILPKVLEENPKSINKIRSELKENYNIDVSEDSITEILDELKERNTANSCESGWLKTKP